jgi:hypothetical protein
MKTRHTLAAAAAVLLLAACSSKPSPAADAADQPQKATLALCTVTASAAPTPQAASASAAPPACVVTSKRMVPPVMEQDYDKKCVAWKPSGSCKTYKKVKDGMDEVSPGYLELCASTPRGEACGKVDDATWSAYQEGDVFVGPVAA